MCGSPDVVGPHLISTTVGKASGKKQGIAIQQYLVGHKLPGPSLAVVCPYADEGNISTCSPSHGNLLLLLFIRLFPQCVGGGS